MKEVATDVAEVENVVGNVVGMIVIVVEYVMDVTAAVMNAAVNYTMNVGASVVGENSGRHAVATGAVVKATFSGIVGRSGAANLGLRVHC
jgi:hypothetical protein